MSQNKEQIKQEKKWREEFEKLEPVIYGNYYDHYHNGSVERVYDDEKMNVYLAACKKRQEDIGKFFQERCREELENFNTHLDKRDKLLRVADSYVKYTKVMTGSAQTAKDCEQWEKDYEALKGDGK